MNLEIIRTQTTWNDAAGSINSNYAKIADAIAQLKANGGGGGGGADIDLTAYATKVWVEAKGYITASTLTPYALKTDIPSLVGYATEDFVNNQLGDYATKDYVTTKLVDYAPLASVQGFENRIGGLEGAVPQLNERVSTVEGKVSSLNETVSTGENNLLGRVNVIEEEYASKSDLESAINDIDLSAYLLKADLTKSRIQSTLGISDWALAATKPSYEWSEITSRPTALSEFKDNVVAGKYLPLSGGMVNGSITATSFIGNLTGALTTEQDIVFNTEKYADAPWARGLVFRNNESEYGNICYVKTSHNYINITHGAYNATLGLRILENGNIIIGSTGDSGEKLQVNGNGKFSGALTANSFIGNLTGTAGSATKLAKYRKLWGNDFDGTADVSGRMYVGEDFFIENSTTGRQLSMSSYWTILGYNNPFIGNPTYVDGRNVYIRYGNDEYASVFASNGNVGIGNTSPTERLDVTGNVKASGNINATSITINGVTITASNGSITVNGNVFATGDITGGV